MRRDDMHPSPAALEETAIDREFAGPAMDAPVPVDPTESACCCPSRPAVRVVLPRIAHRDHVVDLLLCWHHYRRSLTTLARMRAGVFDASGMPLY